MNTWYGFPLAWKETADIFCGPFNPPPCLSDIILNIYNPVFFIADVAFYTLVGYVLLRIYRKFRFKKQFSTSAKTPETTQILGLDMF